ncbi:Os02g0796800 [Oryza sativa Japonica Group]|uniref:Os02g0796800 protein n=3 Tax=Oryza TaxID=4527 RepID=A0A0P0VQV9_ORYSJ|nr:hypothetical protein OsJ_08724 [Oryza sativa Japonica Group]BAD19087.1 hypothetical protein [Oryza sativa Japonica Group]BAS81370.1 Os02g0796800 [Oryza sativa Japonica Group]
MSSSQARRPRFPRGPAAALLRYQFKTVRPPTKDIVELLPEGGSRTVPRSVLHGSALADENKFKSLSKMEPAIVAAAQEDGDLAAAAAAEAAPAPADEE